MCARTYPNPVTPSAMDIALLAAIRSNVEQFLASVARDIFRPGMRVLDVAPEIHAGIRAHLPSAARVETLDIDPASGATFVADLCRLPESMPWDAFDLVVCTEVLEHTLDPFAAVRGIRRLLAPGGVAAVSVPFNFRIHGPLPDCWRFTEHGLRVLFRDFRIEQLNPLETPDRPLMPMHYTLLARRPA